eukprot:20659-Heterococcus_DN1.PRE.1
MAYAGADDQQSGTAAIAFGGRDQTVIQISACAQTPCAQRCHVAHCCLVATNHELRRSMQAPQRFAFSKELSTIQRSATHWTIARCGSADLWTIKSADETMQDENLW